MEDKAYPIPIEPRRRDEESDLPDIVFKRPLTLYQLLEACKERGLNMRISFGPVTNVLEMRFERYVPYRPFKEKAGVTLNLHACEAFLQDISQSVFVDDTAIKDEYIAFHIAKAINTI